MMTYGWTAQTQGNGILSHDNLKDYRTLRGLRRAISHFLRTHRRTVLGEVIFSYSGGEDGTYKRENYTTIERRSDYKPFYAYWG